MKKIIVTGGLGFIGSNLIDLLIKKKYYVINIDKKQNYDDFVTAIFHELVHVKQYLKNEMDNYSFRTTTDYYMLPQEQEAYLLQEELLKQWDSEKKN